MPKGGDLTNRQRVALVGVLLALLTLAACGGQPPYQWKGTGYPEGKIAQNFELIAENGQPLQLSDLQGQVVLIFFGYTSCPDICPTTLAEARQVMDGLGDGAGEASFLFITVDPVRDTPEKLAAYTDIFHQSIVGLTGDPETLAAVRDAYGVIAEREETPDSALDYVINHTARVFLVDPQGNLRLSYGYGTPPADILSDVQHLLES